MTIDAVDREADAGHHTDRGLLFATAAVLLFGLESDSSACLRMADAARLSAGLSMVPIEVTLIERETFSLGSDVVGERLLRFAELNPVQVFRRGRWEAPNRHQAPFLEMPPPLSDMIGTKVRVFGNYVRNKRRAGPSFIVGAPPDSCGGALALELKANLPASRNPVVVEGTVIKGKSGTIGRGHPLIGVLLHDAQLVAQGDAAVAIAMAP